MVIALPFAVIEESGHLVVGREDGVNLDPEYIEIEIGTTTAHTRDVKSECVEGRIGSVCLG